MADVQQGGLPQRGIDGSIATPEMRLCGAVFPQGRSSNFGHSREGKADGHHWKFMWHTEDGEPQVIKCRKCKYTLWKTQCSNNWNERPPVGAGHVSPKFGGYQGSGIENEMNEIFIPRKGRANEDEEAEEAEQDW